MKFPKFNDQVTPGETAEILRCAEQCLRLDGDFVELGCYKGDTSILLGKLLAQHAKTCGKTVENSKESMDNLCKNSITSVQNHVQNPVEKRLWIYDSFAGLPEKTSEDSSSAGQNFQAGELFVTKREVVDKIRKNGLHNVIIKKAWFDDLTNQDLPGEIAFAFLDGDLYSSIKTSLKLVVPLLNPQGIIIVHDYNNSELPGSARAVDEFLRAHRDYRLTVRHTLAIIDRLAK